MKRWILLPHAFDSLIWSISFLNFWQWRIWSILILEFRAAFQLVGWKVRPLSESTTFVGKYDLCRKVRPLSESTTFVAFDQPFKNKRSSTLQIIYNGKLIQIFTVASGPRWLATAMANILMIISKSIAPRERKSKGRRSSAVQNLRSRIQEAHEELTTKYDDSLASVQGNFVKVWNIWFRWKIFIGFTD